jgi:hypothetical protein
MLAFGLECGLHLRLARYDSIGSMQGVDGHAAEDALDGATAGRGLVRNILARKCDAQQICRPQIEDFQQIAVDWQGQLSQTISDSYQIVFTSITAV